MLGKLNVVLLLKILAIIVGVFLIFIVTSWATFPNLIKDYIETHDKEWTNREITIHEVNFNPLTFTIVFNDVNVTEPDSKESFLHLDTLLINLDFWSLLLLKINTQEISLTNLSGKIVQNGNQFNFSDLLSAEAEAKEVSLPITFNLYNINVLKSSIQYTDMQMGHTIILDSITIKDQSFTATDTIFDADVMVHQLEGGWIKGTILYNLANGNYELDTHIERLELAPFKNYVTSVIRLSEFKGQLGADLKIAGNTNTDYLKSSGQLSIIDFKIADPENKPLMSVGRFFVDVKQIDSKTNVYDFKEILVDGSNINFEYLPNEDNFTKLLVGANSLNPSAEKKKEKEEVSKPIAFNLHNINILKSSIQYTDMQLGHTIILDSITIKDQSFTATDTIFDADVAIHQPEGGWIKGTILYNLANSDYELDTHIERWQLTPFKDYATAVIRLSEFKGQLDADLKIAGNTDTDYLKSSGQLSVVDFKMVDPENKPLMSVGKFFVDVKQIDSEIKVYDFKEILVDDSNINFEYLPNGDNFTKLLVGSNTLNASTEENKSSDYYVSPFEMLSVYIYDMTKEYIFKSYTAENILFSNLNLKFYDYTLEDPFYMDLENIEINAKDIKPENQFANFNVNGKINKTGTIEGAVLVSRQGVENMTVDMNVKGLFLNRFSPYGRFYTAHHFMEGIASFNNKSVIKDSYLTSTNKLFVEKIKVSKKNKTRSGYSLPMRFVVALMKDSKGNIDLEIPIEGPINDPKYKFGKVIWQTVKNLFTKIVTSPVKALSNAFKINEDDLKNVYFSSGQIRLSPSQKKTLDALVNILNKKTELTIAFNHLYNREYEMDGIALKSTKISYLKQSDLKLDSQIPIGKHAFDLPSTDPAFLAYFKNSTPNFDETISIPENARRLLGQETITNELNTVIAMQKQLIKDYLTMEKSIPENRFTIRDQSNTEVAINQSRPKFEVTFEVE